MNLLLVRSFVQDPIKLCTLVYNIHLPLFSTLHLCRYNFVHLNFLNLLNTAKTLESLSDKKNFEILVRDMVLKGPPPF